MALFGKKRQPPGGQILVAGLGNPGEEYARSRHNAGFMVVRLLLERHGFARPRLRYGGRWAEGKIAGQPVTALMPQTYMNRSGDSVAEAAAKKHVPPGRIIVIHDDMDFPFATIRCRIDGGEGGHNGLSSITSRLGTREYIRVRFGIGRPDRAARDSRDWVLSPFTESQLELEEAVAAAADCVETIIRDGIESAMNFCNRRETEGSD